MGRFLDLAKSLYPALAKCDAVILWGAREHADLCAVAGRPGRQAIDDAAVAMLGCLNFDAEVHVYEELPPFLQERVLERGIFLVARDQEGVRVYMRQQLQRTQAPTLRREDDAPIPS